MSKVKQNNIEIGDKVLIEINYNRVTYYPVTHIYRDILLKSKQSASKLIKDGYKIKQLEVNFGYDTGGMQKSQCISQESLIDLLKKSNIGGFTVKQKEGMNLLLEYLGMDLINEKPRFVDDYNYMNSSQYGEFAKDCITETLKLDKSLKWQLCKDCEKYYPLHTNFFTYNTKQETFRATCKDCQSADNKHRVVHPDKYLNGIYNKFGIDTYVSYRNNDTVNIFNHFITHKLKTFPKILDNVSSYSILLKHLYCNGKIDKYNLNVSYLRDELKLLRIFNYFDLNEVHDFLFNGEPSDKPWLYPNYSLKDATLSDAKLIVKNYLKYKQIDTDDVYVLDYAKIMQETKLRKFDSDLLGFAMKIHGDKYPAYKFKIASVNYWKNEDNRNKALKYLVEKDMELETEKIPLYLTITSIKSVSNTMYNVLKKYYANLYEWVNDVYPDIFNPKDFDINYMRNEFDSIDEHTIDKILRDSFENVLYNPSQSEYTVKLFGKVPDWFVITEGGCIIVEYFGLWNKERGMYNARTRDYINRSKDKIEKYKALKGYRFLYFYPEDMDNNYEGIYGKIKDIKK